MKKTNAGVIIGIVFGSIAVLALAAFIVLASLLYVISKHNSNETGNNTIQGNAQEDENTIKDIPEIYEDYYSEHSTDEYDGGNSYDDFSWLEYMTQYDESDNPFLSSDYVSPLGINHINHDYDSFTDGEYPMLCDAINYSVPYKIVRNYYCYKSSSHKASINVSCVQLQGDIPNIDEINIEIFFKTMLYARMYLEEYKNYVPDDVMYISIDSLITYNDDKVLSIVLDEELNIDGTNFIDLYCINVDLQSGMIYQNDNILELNEEFAENFKQRSEIQNGYSEVLDNMSAAKILYNMMDSQELIIFFTPVGMEIGMNYDSDTEENGWVTVTYNDYLKYIKSM